MILPGDPIVFVPGFMCDARAFLPQIVQLGARHACQVFLAAGEETVERNAEQLLATAPSRFILVGHGLGGDVAIDAQRRAPDRVARLVLISTDPLAEPPKDAAAREARIVAAKSGLLVQAAAEDCPPEALAQTEWRDEVQALLADMALQLGEGVYIRQSRALQRRPDQSKHLRRALLPALILAGEEDGLVPLRRQEFLSGLLPHSQFRVIPGAGNLPMLEQPEFVTRALEEFLGQPLPERR